MDLPNLTSPEARARLASLQGRRVGIVGLGREGVDLVRFLVPRVAEVVVSDRSGAEALRTALAALEALPVRYVLGHQTGRDLIDCDEIFVSPGVPKGQPVVAEPAANGVPVSSATRLIMDLYPGPIAGITGSSGKTTTTSMVAAILAEAGIPSMMGGNIGMPMLARLPEATVDTWCILELSSFQLEDVTRSPHVAAVLNILPDHLDRHASMADYVRAKANTVRHQTPSDTAILNADDPEVRSLEHVSGARLFSLEARVPGAWLEGNGLWLDGEAQPVLARSELNLLGLHNVANALAAMATARAVGCSTDAIARALRDFRPIAHRLEVVDVVGGVTYINDSIATTPARSMAALRAVHQGVVLIAGGRDKRLPMDEWAHAIAQRVRAVVLVGEAAWQIRGALERAEARIPVITARQFKDAVPTAAAAARPGDVVLLSPGCTSFDEFPDYTARGEAFRAFVRALRHP